LGRQVKAERDTHASICGGWDALDELIGLPQMSVVLDSLNITERTSVKNDSVLNSIGNTPLQKLNVSFRGQTYEIFGKLEFVNPSGSIKDRIAKYMIEQAERRGLLGPGSVIVEATSGNTGIALSMVAAAKGYKMLVVMPEHMTGERIKIMANLGACICLTPKNEGFEGAVARAADISKSDRHYFLTDQFRNPDNAMAHYHTTGQEIIQQAGEKIDAFVAGVGTGGTLMGVGKALRKNNEKMRLIAVEPDEAAILSGQKELRDHKIAGIGDGFVPEIVNRSAIDQIVRVRSEDAVEMAKRLSSNLGLMVGVSSGANVFASIMVLDEIGRDKRVVTVLPDRAERYFSTDLFLGDETQIRQCSMHCECPFYTHGLIPHLTP
jgi:cysteine synthase A